MQQLNSSHPVQAGSTSQDGTPVTDGDLDTIAGGGISGQKDAARLLDEHLASLDILSKRTDMTMEQKLAMKASYEAMHAKRLSETVMFSTS